MRRARRLERSASAKSRFRTLAGSLVRRDRGRLPDFVVIGAQRSGTTTLYLNLTTHPKVVAARIKEVHFFDNNYQRGIDWYRSQFPASGGMTGEASPYYLLHPHAARRMAAHVPDVKLLAILRDPIDRAYSDYQAAVRRGNDIGTFEDAIAEEKELLKPEMARLEADETYRSVLFEQRALLARGEYARQLERWFSCFRRDQFLIMRSDDLYGDPQGMFARVFEFLGLHHHDVAPQRWHTSPVYADMRPETRRWLADYFRPHNERLRDLVGIDFSA